jgi:hypothetical protein
MTVNQSNYSVTVAQELNGIPHADEVDVGIATGVPPQKEWKYFESREPSLLKSDQKPRDPSNVQFPFSDHATTKPVLADTLNRKSTMLKRTQSAYYVLTPSGYLHEYKDSDPVANPEAGLSLRLADCELSESPTATGKIGFSIKGKDAGKKFGGMTHEYPFRFDSLEKATKWYEGISRFVAGGAGMAVSGAGLESSAAKTRTEPLAGTTGQPAQKMGPTAVAESNTSAPTTAAAAAHPTTVPPTAAPTTAAPTTATQPAAGPTTAAHATSSPTTAGPTAPGAQAQPPATYPATQTST